jgi:hypothetical protein
MVLGYGDGPPSGHVKRMLRVARGTRSAALSAPCDSATSVASPAAASDNVPTVMTDVAARFVDDGDIITSAGVSAGIDVALRLVARLAGTERAREVRRGIRYDPHPPV